MGSSNGVSRGQLRPHFSGRSPPFLLAALCVGLGILGVSYWSLCSQFNDLEEQLKKALQRKETIESSENMLQNQLHLREDEFSRAKKELIKCENLIKAKTDEMNAINTKYNSLKESNNKCNEELSKNENQIGDVKTKLKDIEQERDQFSQLNENQKKELNSVKLENERLKAELEEIRKRLITNNDGKANNNSITKSSLSSSVNVVQAPHLDNNIISSNDANNVVNNVVNNVDNNVNNNVNNNVLKKPTQENKDLQKSQAEAPESAANNENVGNAGNADNADNEQQSLKQPESVIAEPNKIAQQLPSITGLAEEDRKEDNLVNVDMNEDMKKDQNKFEEESNDFKQQL